MTRFRGCIDIHSGSVKQIVGSTLTSTSTDLQTNHTSPHPSSHFSTLYRQHDVTGSHVILLSSSDAPTITSARAALAAWPGSLQVGGGVTASNAASWIAAGASKVVVTSWLFPAGRVDFGRAAELVGAAGGKERVVIDLSCRKVVVGEKDGKDGKDGKEEKEEKKVRWMVAMDRWQVITDVEVCKETLETLSSYCSEFLIHAADVEGLCRGIDKDLVKALGEWSIAGVPITYAGGGKSVDDLTLVRELSGGKVDLTIGSALDIFGGSGVRLEECVEWNEKYGGGGGGRS